MAGELPSRLRSVQDAAVRAEDVEEIFNLFDDTLRPIPPLCKLSQLTARTRAQLHAIASGKRACTDDCRPLQSFLSPLSHSIYIVHSIILLTGLLLLLFLLVLRLFFLRFLLVLVLLLLLRLGLLVLLLMWLVLLILLLRWGQ